MQILPGSRWGASGLLVLLAAVQSVAGEPTTADASAQPPPGLLEFLVEWETGDGQWIDPAELVSPDWPDDRHYATDSKQEQDHE